MKKRIFGAVLCCLMMALCACGVQTPESTLPERSSDEVYRELVEAMKAIPQENVLMEATPDSVFGSRYTREEITGICFGKTVKDIPVSSWDVSRDGNGTVVAWVVGSDGDRVLHIAGEGGLRAPANCRDLFAGYENVKYVDFGDRFDTSAAEDMSGMFRDCSSLEGVLDLSSFQTASVTDMSEMFSGLERAEGIDLRVFDTGKVTDMHGMFRGFGGTELNLESFDTVSVTDMSAMFEDSGLQSLKLKNFDTAAVTNMSRMFSGCGHLKTLDISSFRTEMLTDMSGMFCGCGLSRVDLAKFDTSRVTDMSELFRGCGNLTKLDLSFMDTGRVTSMAYMFFECVSLETVDVSSFDTSCVEDMRGMFFNCHVLVPPSLAHFDVSSVEEYEQFMMSGVKVDGNPWEAIFSSRAKLTFN